MIFKAPEAKLLIVDDSAINLEIVTGLLEPFMIQCKTALSGYEALDMVSKEHFDLILMDHMMPGMDGIDTTKSIRALVPSAKDTPIIALTANVMEGSRAMYLRAGMVELIPKPIDIKMLENALNTWLPDSKKVIVNEEGATKTGSEDLAPLFDCLDCEKALELLGSETVFKKIVADYYKRGNETLKAIENAKTLGVLDEYARLTHTLKSSSRQIGSYELGSLAEKLELAGKASDLATIEEYHTRTMDMFKELLKNLSKYFNEAEKNMADLPPITDKVLNEILDSLGNACDELDMDGMEECENKLKEYSFPKEKEPSVKEVCDAIEHIDVEKCIKCINDLKNDK